MVWSKNRPRAINQGHMRIGSSLQNTSWASALRLFFHVCHMHCHAILVADNTQDPGTEKCKGVQKSTFHLGSWQVTRRMTCMHTLCFYGRRVDSLTLIVSNEAYIIRLNRTLHGKLQDGPDGFLFQWLELSRGHIAPSMTCLHTLMTSFSFSLLPLPLSFCLAKMVSADTTISSRTIIAWVIAVSASPCCYF